MVYTVSQLAERLGATVRGSSEKQLSGLATLQDATAEQLTFLANPQYRKYLSTTQVSCVAQLVTASLIHTL